MAAQVLISGPALCKRLGLTRTQLWEWRNDEALKFPQPLIIRGRNQWRMADLLAWETAQGIHKGAA